MILKVSRFSRRNKVEPWVSFVSFPQGTSRQLATRLLGNKANGISIKRATIEQVELNDVPTDQTTQDVQHGAGQGLETNWISGTSPIAFCPIWPYHSHMNKTQAISILSAQFGATYQGSNVCQITGNLVEDIMNEGDEGKSFHKWNTLPLPTTVEESNLIGLASYYVKKASA